MLGTSKQREAGRKASETKSSLLSQVNQLVTQGLRQAAIDLLEEAVTDAPNDSSLLSALGRIYLLDKQPDKAVIYLRRSLAKSNSNPVLEDDYAFEAFTDADAEYVEEKAEDPSNEDFSILDEVDTEETINERPQNSVSKTLHLNRRGAEQTGEKTTENTEPQITVIKNGMKVKKATQPPKREEEPSTLAELYEPDTAIAGGDVELERASEAFESTPDATALGKPESEIVPHTSEALDQPEAEQLTIPYDDGPDDSAEEIGLPEIESDNLDVVDLDEDEAESFDDDLDEIDPEIDRFDSVPLDEDFLAEDFGWEDLDDFEEDASRENEDEELTNTGLTRAQRARQAAVEVLNRVDWSREYLPLLETTFIESGWGAARIAIEDQIEKGAVPEEIMLAREIRSIWFNNEHLWTSFRMKSNATFMQAEAVYKNFSWADALRLIRCFPSIPDGAEVEAFIDHIYDEWYSNDRLRKHFKAFLKYFRYRIIASKRTLPGDISFMFSSPIEMEWGSDNPELMSSISEMRAELKELGADSGFEMPGTDNKFKILPKEAFDEEKESK